MINKLLQFFFIQRIRIRQAELQGSPRRAEVQRAILKGAQRAYGKKEVRAK